MSTTPPNPGPTPSAALVPVGEQARHALVPARLPTAPPVNLAATMHALRRRWLLAFGLGSLAAVAAGVTAWMALKPAATVRGLLLVESIPPMVAFKTADNEADPRNDFASYQKTQAALV